jgi:hypothetical protein
LRDVPHSAWFWVSATLLWVYYIRLTRRLRSDGLA